MKFGPIPATHVYYLMSRPGGLLRLYHIPRLTRSEMAEAIANEIDCGSRGREDSDIATTNNEEMAVAQLKVGDTFESFEKLEKRLKQFEDRSFVKFWKRESS